MRRSEGGGEIRVSQGRRADYSSSFWLHPIERCRRGTEPQKIQKIKRRVSLGVQTDTPRRQNRQKVLVLQGADGTKFLPLLKQQRKYNVSQETSICNVGGMLPLIVLNQNVNYLVQPLPEANKFFMILLLLHFLKYHFLVILRQAFHILSLLVHEKEA